MVSLLLVASEVFRLLWHLCFLFLTLSDLGFFLCSHSLINVVNKGDWLPQDELVTLLNDLNSIDFPS